MRSSKEYPKIRLYLAPTILCRRLRKKTAHAGSCGTKTTAITTSRIANLRTHHSSRRSENSNIAGKGCCKRVQKNKEIRIHPTQKPIALYAWIFARYAKPGDKIIDTHLGSGSSRIAAYDAGLDFVGCEIDKDYFAAQEERFAAHTAQLSLFV